MYFLSFRRVAGTKETYSLLCKISQRQRKLIVDCHRLLFFTQNQGFTKSIR